MNKSTFSNMPVLMIQCLIAFLLAVMSNAAIASTAIGCPCILTQGSGSSAEFEFDLLFTSEQQGTIELDIELTHSETQSLFTSSSLFEGYSVVGAGVFSADYSTQAQRVKIPMSLNASQIASGYLGVHLSYGSNETSDWVLLSQEKVAWASDGSTIPAEGLSVEDTLIDSDSDKIPDFLERKLGTDPAKAQRPPRADIEVLFTYGSSAEREYSDIQARVAHITAVANLGLETSGLRATLKSIGILDLDYSDRIYNAERHISNFKDRTYNFSGFDSKLDRKPDIVVHLASVGDLGIGGTAPILGQFGDGQIDYTNRFETRTNIAVVGIDSVDRTLGHEIGHLMGLVHSVAQGEADGAFYWSRGHGVEDDFVTIMAYDTSYGSASTLNVYSNPESDCRADIPCGVDRTDTLNGADSVSTLEVTALQVAAIANGFSPIFEDGLTSEVIRISSEEAITVDDVTAYDPEDGDVTSAIQSEVKASESDPTKYNFLQTLTATDNDGNASTINRKILVLVDTDSDGVYDHEDEDDDNDGYLDEDDAFPLNLFEWADFDGDGLGDNSDVDDDNDGFNDAQDDFPFDPEYSVDTDGDGIADEYEVRFGYDPNVVDDTSVDVDGDGLDLKLEFQHRTFPSRADTDRDTLPDKWEVENAQDPLSPFAEVEGEKYTTCTRIENRIVCAGNWDSYNRTFERPVLDYSVGGSGDQCVVFEGGELFCWGNPFSDLVPQTPIVIDATNVAVGKDFACFLRSDRSLDCWGNIEFDTSQLSIADPPRDLVATNQSVCSLADRSVYCWGAIGAVLIEADDLLSSANLGLDHGCASFEGASITVAMEQGVSYRSNGNNICWGDNDFTSFNIPADIVFNSIGGGSDKACGATSEGITCWGRDYKGFLDAPKGLRNAVLGAGNNSICALSLEFGLDCWGDPSNGGTAPYLLIDPDGDGFTSQKGFDVFPLDSAEAFDSDGDGLGDNADPDDDNDGVLDIVDAFPFDATETLDTDGDGLGNNSDNDDDGDQVSDATELEQGSDPLDNRSCFLCQVSLDSGGVLTSGTDEGETISGTDFADELYGLGGNDSIAALKGNDYIEGGSGNDVIYAGPGDDRVLGNEGDDVLSGASGDDVLEGGAGRDVLDGGSGINTLSGGSGSDLFSVTGAAPEGINISTVKDFEVGVDRLASTVALAGIAPADLETSTGQDSTKITFLDGRVLLLQGVPSSEITADTFVCTSANQALTDLLSYSSSTLACDTDGDSWADSVDSCPDLSNSDQSNFDGDEFGDACDADDDNDGIADVDDAFPLNASESADLDGDGVGNATDDDDDGDGVNDADDLFPLDPNEAVDTDGDGIGDNSDDDSDGDGVLNAEDSFPLDATESIDTDGDGVGDSSDPDDDNDGILDVNDAFALISIVGYSDPDMDGYPSDCDQTCLDLGMIADADDDNDGIEDASDAFPLDDSEVSDTDGDGVGDNADVFPANPSETSDYDGDGLGDNADNCMFVSNSSQKNTDGDSEGDACDLDDDNDGVSDEQEFVDGTNPLDGASCSQCSSLFDVDGDGEVRALTDGLIIIRYLFGFTGDSLTSGALGSGASRTTQEIENYLDSRVQ